jgi:hypothetical protein
MIRIRTKIDNGSYVYTVAFQEKWLTFSYHNSIRVGTEEARNLEGAGRNHLNLGVALRERIRNGTPPPETSQFTLVMPPVVEFNEP